MTATGGDGGGHSAGGGAGRPVVRESHASREAGAIWTDVLELARFVNTALHTAVDALRDNRPELSREVSEEEVEIDRWEVRIEKACLRALALYDLVAIDLRRVVGAIRINRELEGLADIAEKLARRAGKISSDPIARSLVPRLIPLAEAALRQVDAAILNMQTLDPAEARSIVAADSVLDHLREECVEEFKEAIRTHPDDVNSYLRLINSARNLERAGDHAAQVATVVVYIKDGHILHHGKDDDL